MKKIVLGIIVGSFFVNSGLAIATEQTTDSSSNISIDSSSISESLDAILVTSSTSTENFSSTEETATNESSVEFTSDIQEVNSSTTVSSTSNTRESLTTATSSDSTIQATKSSESINPDDALYQQYLTDNRRHSMSFDEYKTFQKTLETLSRKPRLTTYSNTSNVPYLTGERKQIVDRAKKYLGASYSQVNRLGPNSFDCSGLTYRVFMDVLKRNIGTYTGTQQTSGTRIAVANAKPGDLIFWSSDGGKSTYHVAIYIGNSQYIHAPNPNEKVNISPIWWKEWPPSFALRMDLKESNTIDLTKYWTKSPGKVVNLKATPYYRSADFSKSTQVGTYALATQLTIDKIVYDKKKVPVFKLKNGYYVSAERALMQKFTYASMKPTQYSVSKSNPALYKNITLMTKKAASTLGKVYEVRGKYTLENGAVIYTLYNKNGSWAGYMNSKDMIPVKYVSWNKPVIINKANYSSYTDFFFSGKKIKNTKTLIGTQYTAKGYYILGDGKKYLTLYDKKNKWQGYLNSAATLSNLTNYYLSSPKKVVALKSTDYYRSSTFTKNTRVGTYQVGTTLDVTSVTYASNGLPVLKLKNGYYLSAEKARVRKFTYTAMNEKYSISTKNVTLWHKITQTNKKATSSIGTVFNVKGRYNIDNGQIIYSLYKKNGTWAGYMNSKNMSQVKYVSWNKNVKITKKNYATYTDFFFSSKKIKNTSSILNKTYKAKGYYILGNGKKYLTLYDKNNKWIGYLNAEATKW
ncbi:DUF5776 domain-containing protein [Vagococcus xieshaowenii]|uniref:Peptidoglycan endopeptidase n=1 Tax=Vagococcus xieshaowenii TaxID=2562451 RepID=A0A4Z0DEB5_9ENTE|nr:DUF5776 domain-containing protein [Vagococcus xieshaowenii]QCA29256.1 peptidoglycan endopeptidase [Vagococcus xieshaowenii]TFZ43190.1 peptidoglycan endopeptidase [Vagococcus xieshaowenii]